VQEGVDNLHRDLGRVRSAGPQPVMLFWEKRSGISGGLAAVGVAQVHCDAAVRVLELLYGIERCVPGEEDDGQFTPPRGIRNGGKPEPASS
jgi:hypothetical protein